MQTGTLSGLRPPGSCTAQAKCRLFGRGVAQLERFRSWLARFCRSKWQQLRASWQLDFGPQGAFWDEPFKEKTLWEEFGPLVRSIPEQAAVWLGIWLLHSRGVSGFGDWATVALVALVWAWVIRFFDRLVRKHWARRHLQR